MKWWQDWFSIKIRLKEFIRLWYLWLFDILLIIVAICLLDKNFANKVHNCTVINILIPTLISIFVTCFFTHCKTFLKNCNWMEKRNTIYRDLLEIFSRIIITITLSFVNNGRPINPLESPLFRGLLSNNMMQDRLNEISTYVRNREQIDRQTFINNNLSEQINILSNQYQSIISDFCTDSTVQLFYTILITDLIKLNEDIIQLNNENFGNVPLDNAYMQFENITREIGLLYNRIFPIVEKILTPRKEPLTLSFYVEKMFEGIKRIYEHRRD